MNTLFESLYQSQKGSQYGLDMEGRATMPYLAVVTTNEDPTGRRRIKVSDPVAPSLETDWIRRILSSPSYDPPLPAIGSTVIIFSIDGDVTNGWYLQCVNDTNPPLSKETPLDDLHTVIAGEQDDRTEGNRVIRVGKSLTLQTDSGASIELSETGDIVIRSGSGDSITLNGGIQLTSTVSIGGKDVAVVGGKDSDQDSITVSGQ